MTLPAQLGIDAMYSVLTLGGLALIPPLWRPFSPTGTTWVRWTYAAWLLLLTILVLACLPAWWYSLSQPLPGLSPQLSVVEAPYLLPGAVDFPLGVLVSGAALSLLLRAPVPLALERAPTGIWR